VTFLHYTSRKVR